MKRLLLLALLLVCPLIAEAQVTSTPVVFVTVAPTVCQPKKLYSLTTNGNLYERLGSSGTTCTLIINASGGVISGSGTTNTITKWTSASALGNSGITDDGTTVVIDAIATLSVGNTTSAATDFLINPTTKASGNLIDAQVNSVSQFKVTSAGVGTFAGTISTVGGYGSNGGSPASQGLTFSGTTTNMVAGGASAIIRLSNNGGVVYFESTGAVTKFNNIATEGMGLVPIYKTPAITGTQTSGVTVTSYTPPAAVGTYRVDGVITTTSGTNTGTVGFTLDYVDSQGTTHTGDIIAVQGAAGTIATTGTAASKEFHAVSYMITINNAATAIVLKTVVTGSVNYTVTGSIEQIR